MEHLSGHHRKTLEHIFTHPTSGNLEWRRVLSLLEAVGAVTEERNGKYKVQIGPETEVIHKPRGKDVDKELIADLRRMLTQAGLNPDGSEAVQDERDRDHGDSRWGKPTE
ncbi:MAG: type II toxin-antitoxin system HicA family toxin [Actinomycetota bacterium]|nr:type II toxin-antitoxin system HicA family toxin [Actinomycetota bacterium]